MKLKQLLTIVLLATATAVSAQTNSDSHLLGDLGNILNDVGLSTNPTNYAIVPFGGVSVGGQTRLAAGLLAIENVNNNVGVVGGIDHLWFGGKTGNANLVSGGLTLKTSLYPFRDVAQYIGLSLGTNTWAYGVKATPYVVALVGTPVNGTSNNGGLCAINRAGVDVDIYTVKGWNFGVGADYGNRSGAGAYSGNYVDFIFSLSKGF